MPTQDSAITATMAASGEELRFLVRHRLPRPVSRSFEAVNFSSDPADVDARITWCAASAVRFLSAVRQANFLAVNINLPVNPPAIHDFKLELLESAFIAGMDAGVPPDAIPSASTVARQAARQAQPAAPAAAKGRAPAAAKSGKSKYLIPAAVIVGGAVAVGGALAIINHNKNDGSGGGGGGGGGSVTNGNYGGNYEICFTPATGTNLVTDCDSGLVNVYVNDGTAEIVGLWGAEVLSGAVQGRIFTATANLGATPRFPSARLIVTGEFSGNSCAARIDGYSTDPLVPGDFSGRFDTTLR